jgi:hypothetical protein
VGEWMGGWGDGVWCVCLTVCLSVCLSVWGCLLVVLGDVVRHARALIFFDVKSNHPQQPPGNHHQVKQMKVEVRSQDPATKAALSIKVQSYEKSLASIKGDLQRAKDREDKDALLGGVRFGGWIG